MYYHYCSIDALKSILASKTLWLSDLTVSNDMEEVTRCFLTLWDNVKTNLDKTNIDKTILCNQIKKIDFAMKVQVFSDKPFGICFCKEKDLVQQWNEYGDDGKGVSVGFDLEWFPIQKQYPITSTNIINATGWNEVIYDFDDYSNYMTDLCYRIIREQPDSAFLTILTTFKHYSGFYKNPTFADEHEVRIVLYPVDNQDRDSLGINNPIITNSNTTNQKHYPINWMNDHSMALKSITLGYNSEYSENDIYRIIQNSNLPCNIKIDKSICSYRKK